MRVAGIDCGTNSIRLLVRDSGVEQDLVRTMRIVRLGEGVDRTGQLSEAALERTFAALDEYASQILELEVMRVRFVATSATRDASNRDVFVAGVRERLGIEPEVITGEEEAALSFRGAIGSLPGLAAQAPLVVDIGGGSTEFVLGSREADGFVIGASRSVDVGCVRMTERRLHDDPPTAEQVDAARADIDAVLELAGQAVPLDECDALVGLAGSVTTVAALALGLPEYDSDRIHGSVISAEDVHAWAQRLLVMTRAERGALPVMFPGREDVIGGGALVLSRIMTRLGLQSVTVSERDILDGIALSCLDAGANG